MRIKADFVSVTCSSDNTCVLDLEGFLAAYSAFPQSIGEGKSVWRFPSCEASHSILIQRRKRLHYFSFSGAALDHLRDLGIYTDIMWTLASVPSTVTRLDIAGDIPRDGADVMDELGAIVPGESSKLLGRKALPVEWFFSRRDSDARYTGTMYIGRGTKARLKLKVYDKAFERRSRASLLIPPTTRYELTYMKDYRGGGISLRDACEPASLFWDGLPSALLDRPANVAPWSPSDAVGWSAGSVVTLLPAEVLARSLDSSPILDTWKDQADRMGPGGRVWLARKLLERLGVEVSGPLSLAPVVSSEASEG